MLGLAFSRKFVVSFGVVAFFVCQVNSLMLLTLADGLAHQLAHVDHHPSREIQSYDSSGLDVLLFVALSPDELLLAPKAFKEAVPIRGNKTRIAIFHEL